MSANYRTGRPAAAGRRRARRASSGGLALSMLAATATAGLVATAPAASAAETPTRFAGGLHLATGALVDPVGRTWVADHNAGFCRVTDPTPAGPGYIEHPQFPGDEKPSTCLGGLLTGAGPGPDAAGTPVFLDPDGIADNGDEMAFVPDGAAPSSDIVRLRWNADTDKFEFQDTFLTNDAVANGDRARPTALSLGADGNLYVVFQRIAQIQRVINPTAAVPVVQVLGTTRDNRGSEGVAAIVDATGAGKVYVAEAVNGLAELTVDAVPTTTAPANTPGRRPVASFSVPDASKLTTDGTYLYAGTSNAAVTGVADSDAVHRVRLADGAMELNWAPGLTMVGGMGLRNGNLLVVDDPALLDPAEPMGTGRMWLVGLPASRIASGPTNAAGTQAVNPDWTNDTTPTFTVAGDNGATLECSLVPAAAVPAPVWEDCTGGTYPTTPEASRTPMADGSVWSFSVRASQVFGTETKVGLVQGRTFTVDTTAPATAGITAPAAGALVNADPNVALTGEADATFICNRGATEGEYTACASGRPFHYTADGTDTLRVKAVDRAGNVSAEPAVVSYTVDVTAPDLTITSPADGATVGTSPSFAFASTATDVAAVLCRLDGAPFVACDSRTAQGYTNVAEGAHTFQVRAVDRVNNATMATRSFSVARAADDTTPPAITASVASGIYNTAQSVVLSAGAGDADARIFYTVDGSAPSEATGTPYTGPISIAATATLRFIGIDRVGNVSGIGTRTYTIDTVAPTVTAPVAALAKGVLGTPSAPTTPMTVRWTGADGAGSGIAKFVVQLSTNGGAFTTLATPNQLSTGMVRAFAPGRYQIQVQAQDRAGNLSAPVQSRVFAVAVVQQTSSAVRYSTTGWANNVSWVNASGGSLRGATAVGAQATVTFRGTGISFVTTKAASRGRAEIWIDGVRMGTIDLYSATTVARDVAYIRQGLPSGTHTMTIRAIGKNAASSSIRVDADAFAVTG